MKALSHIIVLLLFTTTVSNAGTQQAGVNPRGIVESAEISGIDEGEMSRDTRDAIARLVGHPFDQQAADNLVERIQTEKPEFTATTRLLPADQPDRVKVVFLLERIAGDHDANVNARYTVERVEIQNFDESKLSQSIRDDIKQMVGERLDQDKANQIQHRLDDELRPKRYAVKRIVKGSDRQHIVVVYDIKTIRLIPFVAQLPQRVLYHSKQNFSASIGPNIFDNTNNRFYFGLANDQDLLLERFAGFYFGFESTKVGTEHLGVALRYGRFHDRWQPATVLADQNAIYRERFTFEPTVTVAVDTRLRLSAGVSVSQLQIQYPAVHDANANAAIGSVDFQNVWGQTDKGKHSVQAAYDFRAGNNPLDSDFIYTRHYVESSYVYGHERNELIVRFAAGTISGNAPLFERFSLGNTSTLRGWNKFDVAPAGGDRMTHATLQYGFGGPRVGSGRIHVNSDPPRDFDIHLGAHIFYDVGAVGDRGSPIQARHSVGFGFGKRDFFVELGFPIRSTHVQPIFMMGVRF